MPKITELVVNPERYNDNEHVEKLIAQNLGILPEKIKKIVYLKKSIDARGKEIVFRLRVEVFTIDEKIIEETSHCTFLPAMPSGKECLVVGFGPAGMFACLELLSLGIKPIVWERGKSVKERRRDLAAINKEGIVDNDSNYCFGEGGAGTYSDGKLYTRSNKRGDIKKVLQLFVEHGAHPEIEWEAHPHIGTNKLPAIVENIRETIIRHGGEVHFKTKLENFEVDNGKIRYALNNKGEKLKVDSVLLCTGHSARDIFELLHKKQLYIERKSFALGVRIEHPQSVIDTMQYRCDERGMYLPPASYSLVTQAGGRGVFSFCMCPGGIIAPAATAQGEIVVNGWSPSKRNGRFANSGLVVAVNENDFLPYNKHGALAGMVFQKEIEQKAFSVFGSLKAPAQRAVDFVNNKTSTSLPECSYIPGIGSADLSKVLPFSVADSLRKGLVDFGKKRKSYLSYEAVLVGVESRTSSPAKIPRNRETLAHVEVENLFPCGEGAGYAGGIVSAAMDGMACAKSIKEYYEKHK